MGAWIDLDLGVGALHRCRDLVDDFLRRVDIGFGAAEIKLGLGLARGQMRAVGLVGGQMRAVDRGGGLDPVREMRRRVDGISPAHAVADRADDLRVRGRLLVGIGEQRGGVLHDQGNVDGVHVAEHLLAFRRVRVRRYRSQFHDAGTVIQIRQHHVITRSGQPARHVAQFLADRRRVHVEEDDGKRPAALGMSDESGGMAVLGRNFDLLVDHGAFLLAGRFCDFFGSGNRYDCKETIT